MKDKIFLIPADSLQGKHGPYSILYSPFTHSCSLIAAEEKSKLEAALENGTLTAQHYPEYAALLNIDSIKAKLTRVLSPDQYTTMSLLPTYCCNFKCSYCYSAKGRDKTKISKDNIDTALTYFLRASENKATRKLFISGGGEPLTAWQEVQYSVLKAEALAAMNGLPLEVIIISNGSLLSTDIIEFFIHHNLHLCISFEITQQAQQLSRGHWEQVNAKIRQCIDAGLIPSINTTITPQNVQFLPDMITELLTFFPEIKFVTFEPVTPNNGFESVEAMRTFYQTFMSEFSMARRRCEGTGLDINSTIIDNMKRVAVRHCQGKLCVTPSGSYTICHCASSPKESRYAKCIYGQITDGKVEFDLQRFHELQDINMLHRNECQHCFAKWNCGGGCMSKFDAYPPEQQEEYCRYYREHLKQLLLEEIDAACIKLRGKSLQELIS